MWFRIYDPDPSRGVYEVDPATAREWNEKQWGIFWTVNTFDQRRRKENLVSIKAWCVDLDRGTKDQMWTKIQKFLIPSLVVETKKGFHVYWHTKDATIANHKKIQSALVARFDADENAKDVCRILRVPNYQHWKDPQHPFLVRDVWSYPVHYRESDMLYVLRPKKAVAATDTTPRVYTCRAQLETLSGTADVKFESYEFKPNANGTAQIWVDGKSTAAWIDTDGHIGSHAHGGPTVTQWLYFIWRDGKRVDEIMERHGWKTSI